MRFDEVLYNDDVLDALDAMQFSECTPIQEQAIPVAEQGRDLIAVAQTGTGKTAAYLLPVIDCLADGGYPDDAINCVVMCPTRELAQQIDQQMQGFSYFLPSISSAAIYGGTDGALFSQQKNALVRGADVVIATPGRLLAHMQMGYVDLSRVSWFVLDEADRMLDMGFFDDIMKVVSQLPADRQTLMFSATMPPKIKQLAQRILTDPVEVKIAVSKPAERIRQLAYVVHEGQKEPLLRHIFRATPPDRVIVFSSSKQKVKELTRTLRSWHLPVAEMHSDLDQAKREQTMLDFKAGRVKLLVATDIVARGIDIDDISVVINYDVPHEAEDYVHRVGRTARAASSGTAITLVNERDMEKFGRIEALIEREVEKGDVPSELGATPAYNPRRGARGGHTSGARKGRGEGRKDRGRGEGRNKARTKKQPKATRPPEPQPQKPKADKPQSQTPTDPAAAPVSKRRNGRRHRGGRHHGSKPTEQS